MLRHGKTEGGTGKQIVKRYCLRIWDITSSIRVQIHATWSTVKTAPLFSGLQLSIQQSWKSHKRTLSPPGNITEQFITLMNTSIKIKLRILHDKLASQYLNLRCGYLTGSRSMTSNSNLTGSFQIFQLISPKKTVVHHLKYSIFI